MANIEELFGSSVFNDAVMQKRLPKDIYKALHKTITDGTPLDPQVANVVANAMKDWAVERGVTHYTHWFQPLTGITAEKHDSFISPKDGGKIINVASMLSYQGGIRVPSYTASKSAIMGLTKALANEWAKYNINVNAIAPGYMATNNTAQLRSDDDRSDEILSRIPAGRWGTPEDMQGAVVWLASKASDYVNGYTVAVDGGWLAR